MHNENRNLSRAGSVSSWPTCTLCFPPAGGLLSWRQSRQPLKARPCRRWKLPVRRCEAGASSQAPRPFTSCARCVQVRLSAGMQPVFTSSSLWTYCVQVDCKAVSSEGPVSGGNGSREGEDEGVVSANLLALWANHSPRAATQEDLASHVVRPANRCSLDVLARVLNGSGTPLSVAGG